MEERNLDGVYFRIKRNEEWRSLCFSDLTLPEMEEVLSGKSDEWLRSLCKILGQTIRLIGDDLDICIKDE